LKKFYTRGWCKLSFLSMNLWIYLGLSTLPVDIAQNYPRVWFLGIRLK